MAKRKPTDLRDLQSKYIASDKAEARAAERAEHRLQLMRGVFYEEVDPRRRQERIDSNMIYEDQNAMSNLPEKAIHREYPLDGVFANPFIHVQLIGEDA